MSTVNEYLENQILTANPHRLHLLVVDGALRHARLGLEALQQNNIEEMFLRLNKSREFVNELICGINPDGDPDLTARMKSLLAFIYRNLVLADVERSPQRVEDAIKILTIHRETWVELGQKLASLEPRRVNDDEMVMSGPHSRSWST